MRAVWEVWVLICASGPCPAGHNSFSRTERLYLRHVQVCSDDDDFSWMEGEIDEKLNHVSRTGIADKHVDLQAGL